MWSCTRWEHLTKTLAKWVGRANHKSLEVVTRYFWLLYSFSSIAASHRWLNRHPGVPQTSEDGTDTSINRAAELNRHLLEESIFTNTFAVTRRIACSPSTPVLQPRRWVMRTDPCTASGDSLLVFDTRRTVNYRARARLLACLRVSVQQFCSDAPQYTTVLDRGMPLEIVKRVSGVLINVLIMCLHGWLIDYN